MAARWGAGEETLTIGGMELFTAGGPLQCNVLEDNESCSGLSDLGLDAGGFLGTFQGYVDHSIISIIDDTGALAEDKGHFDEENELSLLNALTEILDNADDENMSPFDTIPDTELLVSPKDNSTFQRFLSLSRTPPDCAVSPLDDQRRINGKFDTSGQIWELFTENISSTPKRPNRQRNMRGCQTLRLKPDLAQQRSDGEDEEVPSPEKKSEKDSTPVTFETEFAVNSVSRENAFEEEVLMKRIPCIINTENVALNDLVKYMHPYCLPSIAACMGPKESEIEDNLTEGIFLEIVANGKCIKLPVLIEPAEEMLESEGLEEKVSLSGENNSEIEMQQSSEEQSGSLQDSDQYLVKSTDECTQSLQEPILLDCKEMLPILSSQGEESTLEPQQKDIVENEPKFENTLENNGLSETILKQCNDFDTKVNDQNLKPTESGFIKKDNESEDGVQDTVKEHLAQKGKKSHKASHDSQKKLKIKNKTIECKQQDVVEKMPLPNKQLPVCVSNPVVQESDFLIKQLEQVKRESQMELRSSKMVRAKARSRQNMDISNASVKKLHNGKTKKIEKPIDIENEQAKKSLENPASEKCLAQNSVEMVCEKAEGKSAEHIEGNTVLNDKPVDPQEDEGKDYLPNIQCKESLNLDQNSTVKGEVENDPNALQMTKEAKPKYLSLSEYRMRMQQRKPNTEQRDHESKSESKWPSIPEPPTELAEIPCLVVPGKEEVSLKPSKVKPLEEKQTRAEEPTDLENSSSSVYATSSQPVPIAEDLQPKQPDVQAQTVAMDIVPFSVASQPNVPPPCFYTPTWPSVPMQPPYYPNVPPPNAVTFPNGVPHDPLHTLPMPPPPVMAWPPFPPPPFAMGPVPSPDMPLLGAGLPPPPLPFWPQPPVQQGLPERGKENISAVSSQKSPSNKPDNSGLVSNTNDESKPPKEFIKQNTVPLKQPATRTSKLPAQRHSDLRKSDLSKSAGSAEKILESMPAEPKKVNLLDTNFKLANPVVLKIMEILKKAQKLGFQINSPQPLESGSSKSGTLIPSPLQPIQKPCKEQGKVNPRSLTQSINKDTILENQAKGEPINIASEMQKQGKAESSKAPNIQPAQQQISIDATLGETRADGNLKITSAVANDAQAPVESFTCEEGIEATDLTSLLEQFEKSEANTEERHTQSPELKVAVGNSGSERPVEKKVLDRLVAPELASTAGLTPPATPPHQMWKPAIASTGKAKPLHGNFQDRPCASALKAAKLIEAKPLPQSKLRNKSTVIAPVYVQPPIHVASGDHDYCIFASTKSPVTASSALTQSEPEAVTVTQPSHCEEGSRWNVKHHQNITIKPIVPFNKRAENKLCQNQATTLEAKNVCNRSMPCGTNKSVPSLSNSQKNTNDPLDHRTNVVEAVAEKHPGSVLMSPDASPCRSEDWETRTSVRRVDTAFSQRSLHCYRRHRSSPSPQKSSSSRSCSSDSSCSSSSSSSRSRSPPSKRQRIYTSRSRHRSRSSSRSRYHGSSSRSWSSSSSYSSRSCSPSSSYSRSRSRSPCRRRYRSRSRRCESRESRNRQKIEHKERAIEERRVVYIGKINSLMTRTELKSRFSVFGEIEECTIHFREEGDNYGFVTYRYTCEAFAAIENGHKLRLPNELPFDLCFGGRRQFCKSSYADLDSNKDEFDPVPIRSKFESLDFDTLLKQAQKKIQR